MEFRGKCNGSPVIAPYEKLVCLRECLNLHEEAWHRKEPEDLFFSLFTCRFAVCDLGQFTSSLWIFSFLTGVM